MLSQLLACWLCSALVAATNTSEPDPDPYLRFRPAFARSLPIQILLTGVVLTLVAVLFIHLVFTAQYHWPLAPVNYVLQLSGVATLLISLIATLHVVLSASLAESEMWPYMLSYIAVNVPPFIDPEQYEIKDWTPAEQATWLVMNASTSALIQITHIQFLTLLYPSRLEGRLIFTLLGPLAVVAAVMQLIPISQNDNTNNIASAIRNVCNATLSLLFTAALFIWGFLVNRKQAWRTDGGTAAFGCAALALAVASTALNFLYVHREEEYVWLPSLMWAVVLWQSFLGWWWWVGAGSGSGLLDDDETLQKLERKAKRENRRKEVREKRRLTTKRAKNVWRGVTGAFNREGSQNDETTVVATTNIDSDGGSPVRTTSRSPGNAVRARRTRAGQETSPSQASSVGSNSSSSTFHTLPRLLPAVIHRWYASLRHAHAVAARQQAVERVERIRELDREGALSTPQHGWGLGSFGWRINRDQHPRAPPETDGEGGASDIELTDRHERVERVSRWQQDSTEERNQEPEKETSRPSSIPPRNTTRDDEPVALAPPVNAHEADRPRSFFWWGPLANWRLQDSTSYK